MSDSWTEVALGEVVDHRKEFFEIDDLATYKRCRVKLHAKGVQKRDEIAGDLIKTKKQQRCHANDFLVAEIDAKVGGFGIVPEHLDGAIVSSHYFLFSADVKRLDYRFLGYFCRTSRFFEQVAAQGSTNYAAIRPHHVLDYKIPLPSLAEQQRIVAHLDAIETRLDYVQKLRDEARTEAQALTISIHHHLSNERVRRLDELLRLDEEPKRIAADGSYPQVGIRSFGEGMFRKPPTLGSDTTYRNFNTLRAGKLVMSQVKGWEGAVAVCPDHLDGWFVSPEYRTFACREGECDPNYLSHLVKTPWFQERLASATRGVGARRERIRPEMLLGIEIPFPDLNGQRTALKTIEHMTEAKVLSNKSASHAQALLPSLLDQVFNG